MLRRQRPAQPAQRHPRRGAQRPRRRCLRHTTPSADPHRRVPPRRHTQGREEAQESAGVRSGEGGGRQQGDQGGVHRRPNVLPGRERHQHHGPDDGVPGEIRRSAEPQPDLHDHPGFRGHTGRAPGHPHSVVSAVGLPLRPAEALRQREVFRVRVLFQQQEQESEELLLLVRNVPVRMADRSYQIRGVVLIETQHLSLDEGIFQITARFSCT